MPRLRQRQVQEGDRAEHEPPLPRWTRAQDRREISQQPDEAQEDQELVFVRAYLQVRLVFNTCTRLPRIVTNVTLLRN